MNKTYTVGDRVVYKLTTSKSVAVTINGERCWQCRCISIGTYRHGTGIHKMTQEVCVNDCGPKALGQMMGMQ